MFVREKARGAVLTALIVLLAGCATVPPQVTQTSLPDVCQSFHISWQMDEVTQAITLRRGAKEARLLVGSDIVLIGHDRIQLRAPLTLFNGMIIVPPDFKKKVIDRLLTVAPVAEGRRFTVVLDAGHGGKDPGAIGRSGVFEKDVVLDITQRLKASLEKRGIDVVMTRDRDEFITLAKRTEIASRVNADLFLSIHANTEPSRRVRGVEVYSAKDLGYQEKREEQRLRNLKIMAAGSTVTSGSAMAAAIVGDMMYFHKRLISPELAGDVARKLSRDLKTSNRGARRSGFFVVRNTLMPAVLVEVGFLSHYREEKMLKNSAYCEKIADSLAESVLQYATAY